MFAEACQIVQKFTRPVVISYRKVTGETASSIGSYVILNKDGWILTAAHIVAEVEKFNQLTVGHNTFLIRVEEIKNDPKINAKKKRRQISREKQKSSDLITNLSVWWGIDGVREDRVVRDDRIDLAAVKLVDFDPSVITTTPFIKNPNGDMLPGTSLCRLGFPFHSITPEFKSEENTFHLPEGSVPLPFFPIEGIHTRTVNIQDDSGSQIGQMLETSSPGFRGQSGGPIFDTSGTVWAIQSQTHHQPLGFAPVEKKRSVPQFVNLGWGVHPRLIVDFLQKNEIEFDMR